METRSGDAVVSVVELSKSYGPVQALKQVSLSISTGETVVLIGPNGAGKTTLLEILSGLRTPNSGQVTIFGIQALDKKRSYAHKIGVQLQETKLFLRLTPMEYFQFFIQLYDRHVDLDELIEAMDLGQHVNTRIGHLSGGWRQRIGLALAIINDPELILLDEPTVGLDPIARREFWRIIKKLQAQKKTILLTTHYMEEATALADRIVMLARGSIVYSGSPQEVIELAASMQGGLDEAYEYYASKQHDHAHV